MLGNADYDQIQSTQKMLKDDNHVRACFPTFLKTCLENRLWEREVEDPYSDRTLPPVSFHDFVHKGGARGLGSSYEAIEAIIAGNADLIALWESVSGRKVGARSEPVAVAAIRRDGGTQSRAGIDQAVVAEYAEQINSLPPVTLYFDGEAYWLADGFHRVAAHEAAGRAEVLAEVKQGSRRDAVLHSVGANSAHGLRRTNADKRRAVELLLRDEEWGAKSDRWVAERCGVSNTFVGNLRRNLGPTVNGGQLETRGGRDGKTRKLPTKPQAPEVPAEPAPEPDPAPASSTPAPEPTAAPATAPEPPEPPPEPAPDAPQVTHFEPVQVELGSEPDNAPAPPKCSPAVDRAVAAFEALSSDERHAFVERVGYSVLDELLAVVAHSGGAAWMSGTGTSGNK